MHGAAADPERGRIVRCPATGHRTDDFGRTTPCQSEGGRQGVEMQIASAMRNLCVARRDRITLRRLRPASAEGIPQGEG